MAPSYPSVQTLSATCLPIARCKAEYPAPGRAVSPVVVLMKPPLKRLASPEGALHSTKNSGRTCPYHVSLGLRSRTASTEWAVTLHGDWACGQVPPACQHDPDVATAIADVA